MAADREKLLKIIVGIHFVYTNFVLMTEWLPTSYFLTQATIIVLGVWAIVNRENVIQIELLMVVKLLSILLDIIAIGMYFKIADNAYSYRSSYFRFSVSFAIFLLILKPVMVFFLNTIRKERAGNNDSPTFGGWGIDFSHRVPGYQPVGDNPATPQNA